MFTKFCSRTGNVAVFFFTQEVSTGMSDVTNESLIEMYIYETEENIEQIERTILLSEETDSYSSEVLNEIFRLMHTIKGSSAMMNFRHISALAHSLEDLFFFIRENQTVKVQPVEVNDLVFSGIDFIREELKKLKSGREPDGNSEKLTAEIRGILEKLKTSHVPAVNKYSKEEEKVPAGTETAAQPNNGPLKLYKVRLFFKEGSGMENIRAYGVVHHLREYVNEIRHIPKNIIDDHGTAEIIKEKGFTIYLKTGISLNELRALLSRTVFLDRLEVEELHDEEEIHDLFPANGSKNSKETEKAFYQVGKAMISVSMSRLDQLMDLVGEMVIAEAMVTQNPEIRKLELESFEKAARRLHRITLELQDLVMSIRMVPIAGTFQKMHRIVRDMSKKLGKDVKLEIIGEETEVDKNIVEHISDPLMHLVRNAVDHGIEDSTAERIMKNKPETGKVTLEAKNAGNDVCILVKDDGRGLNKEKILKRAMEKGLLTKSPEEMTTNEIYQLIFEPGFSTNEQISEYSGRGVGMDVVVKNIEAIGGNVSIDSKEGEGTVVTMKIPLTLAIIEGMNVLVGENRYTIPISAIKESFKAKGHEYFRDPAGNEMIWVRGKLYPIIRLHECFSVPGGTSDISGGILIMVEEDEKSACLLADRLIGRQNVVVKPLPAYIKNFDHFNGISGCTLLGDGSISLILNVSGLIESKQSRTLSS